MLSEMQTTYMLSMKESVVVGTTGDDSTTAVASDKVEDDDGALVDHVALPL